MAFNFTTSLLAAVRGGGSVIALCLFSMSAYAQYSCGMEDVIYAESFDPSENRSGCDIDLTNVPVKIVRVIIHVFQKDDGSENIPNNTSGQTFLYNMWNDASTKFRDLKPMSSPTPSPYIRDLKVNLNSVGIYFWKNTTMWSKRDKTNQNGTALYNYVMSQNIPDKDRAIHIFLPGVIPGGTGGIASGYGDVKWSLLVNVYNEYLSGKFWLQGANLRHELGHNFGLYHPWNNDRCDDTPVGYSSQFGYDNNVVGYNTSNNALTHDQVTRVHRLLQDKSYLLSAGAETSVLTGTVDGPNNQYDGPLYTTNQTGATTATVSVSGPSVSSIAWVKTSGSGSFTSSNFGKFLSLSNLGSINLHADWTKNCVDFSATHAFYQGFSYLAGPNPATSSVQVTESGEALSAYTDKTNQPSGITKIEVYDYNNQLVSTQVMAGGSAARVDVAAVPAGTMYLLVYGSAETPVTMKMIKQ